MQRHSLSFLRSVCVCACRDLCKEPMENGAIRSGQNQSQMPGGTSARRCWDECERVRPGTCASREPGVVQCLNVCGEPVLSWDECSVCRRRVQFGSSRNESVPGPVVQVCWSSGRDEECNSGAAGTKVSAGNLCKQRAGSCAILKVCDQQPVCRDTMCNERLGRRVQVGRANGRVQYRERADERPGGKRNELEAAGTERAILETNVTQSLFWSVCF